MNMIMRGMASLARNFLAYVDSDKSKEVERFIQPPIDNYGAQDLLEKESWRSLNVLDRKVSISSEGRVKYMPERSGRSAYVITPPVIKRAEHHSISHVIVATYKGKRYKITLSTAKLVLLKFKGEPSWAKRFPDVLQRSTSVVVYKNDDTSDCRISNIDWISEGRAERLNDAGRAHLNKLNEEGKTMRGCNHLAPITGDYSYLDTFTRPDVDQSQMVEAVTVETSPPFALEACEQTEWRDVPHFEGFYQVSNLGVIRSLERYVHRFGGTRSDGEPSMLTPENIKKYNAKNYRFVRGRELTPVRKDGELTVTLCRDGLKMPVAVAQVVVETFHPERKAKGLSYSYEYIDGNMDNCKLNNLRFI